MIQNKSVSYFLSQTTNTITVILWTLMYSRDQQGQDKENK